MPLAILLAIATLALFWPATRNDFVNYDDPDYVTSNSHVQSGLKLQTFEWAFTGTVSCNWHPLTLLSHALDCQLYGLQPRGHHLTSVLLHAANAALLYLFLQRLTGSPWRSLFASLLFAWHPLRVESVAWIAERKDVLCGFFWLLTLLAYVGFVARKNTENSRAKCFYGLALLTYAFALLSKPMAVTLPFVLLLLDFWPLKRISELKFQTPNLPAIVREKIPFFFLAAVMSTVAFIVQRNGQAMQTFENLPFSLRVANALVAYVEYLGKFFCPENLAIYYPYSRNLPWALVLSAGLVLLAVSTLAWRARGRFPYFLFGWLWFLGTLVPVIGLVQVGSQAMADRYTYLPSIGLLVGLIWGLNELVSRKIILRNIIFAAAIPTLAGCWILTRQQISFWRDGETLFTHALAVTEDNAAARNGLGFALVKKGRLDEAMPEFTDAIRIAPDFVEPHNNLGNLFALQNRPAEAFAEFQTALQLKPDYADAHFNFGNALLAQDRADEAAAEFQAAARLNPDDREAHYKLGNIFAAQNSVEGAIAEFQAAVRIAPDYFEARNNLGSLLMRAGQTDAAIAQFQETIRRKPDYAEAHYNLGLALMKVSRFEGAISEFQVVTRLAPKFVPAYYSLGLALEKSGRADAAGAEFQTVIGMKPDHAAAHDKLGIILAASGKTDAAIAEFQEAVRLKPDYGEAQTNLARALQIRNATP
ncbi:MAG TPA: tetratricopeptide repeat protein [Candidatus Sulfotelmatobacter sp.]|nr:tetratricopeptide repeat protein [Candidatus Sulfotelmatobacter sp.]